MKKYVVFLLIMTLLMSLGLQQVWAEDLGSWVRKADLPSHRDNLTATAANGKIYAIGGLQVGTGAGSGYKKTVYEYDPTTNLWSSKAEMSIGRDGLSAITVNNKVYAMGGMDENGNYLNLNEMYDPVTNTWTTKANMPVSLAYFAIAQENSKIYVIGGKLEKNANLATYATNAVYEYDTITDTWSTKTSMPTKRSYVSATNIDGKIYVVSGSNYTTAIAYTTAVEMYNPYTDTWTSVAPAPVGKSGASVQSVNGRLYLIGGRQSASVVTNSVEEYNPGTDTWRSVASKRFVYEVMGSAELNGKIYTISGSSSKMVEEFTPPVIESVSIPTNPLNLNATGGNSKVDLTWDAVEGATSYTLKRSTAPGGPYTTIAANLADTTYTDTDVINGTTYYYIVTASNTAGESLPSNEASATPQAPQTSMKKIMLKTDDGLIYSGDLIEQNTESFKLKNVYLYNGVPSLTGLAQPTYPWEMFFMKSKVIWYYLGQ